MNLTRTAYGTWNGGRYMHFGEPVDEARFDTCIRRAYDKGIRTFMTADVYGNGAADEAIGRSLAGLPRDSYCLVGIIGTIFTAARATGKRASRASPIRGCGSRAISGIRPHGHRALARPLPLGSFRLPHAAQSRQHRLLAGLRVEGDDAHAG